MFQKDPEHSSTSGEMQSPPHLWKGGQANSEPVAQFKLPALSVLWAPWAAFQAPPQFCGLPSAFHVSSVEQSRFAPELAQGDDRFCPERCKASPAASEIRPGSCSALSKRRHLGWGRTAPREPAPPLPHPIPSRELTQAGSMGCRRDLQPNKKEPKCQTQQIPASTEK